MLGQKVGNIFGAPKHFALGHCISSDANMGRGVAASFVKLYPELVILRDTTQPVGASVIVETADRIIFNMVTKVEYWSKPSIQTLQRCLLSMKCQALKLGIKTVCLPMIGCGLDKLNYLRDVKPLLSEVSRGSELNIVICTLKRVGMFRYSLDFQVLILVHSSVEMHQHVISLIAFDGN